MQVKPIPWLDRLGQARAFGLLGLVAFGVGWAIKDLAYGLQMLAILAVAGLFGFAMGRIVREV